MNIYTEIQETENIKTGENQKKLLEIGSIYKNQQHVDSPKKFLMYFFRL